MLGADTPEYLLQERERDMNHIQPPACAEEAPEKKKCDEVKNKSKATFTFTRVKSCRGNMKLHIRLYK